MRRLFPSVHHIIAALCTETPGLGAMMAQYAPERASLCGSQAVLDTLDAELGLGTEGRRRTESAVGKG